MADELTGLLGGGHSHVSIQINVRPPNRATDPFTVSTGRGRCVRLSVENTAFG